MKLSSSDGTQLTVDELREAYSYFQGAACGLRKLIREIISPAILQLYFMQELVRNLQNYQNRFRRFQKSWTI